MENNPKTDTPTVDTQEITAPVKKEVKVTSFVKKADFGTKKIYLRREEMSGHLPKEIRAESTYRLASVFKNRQPLKGFITPAEEKKYLAPLLEAEPGDREWAKEVRKFWAELRIPVGFAGVEFEIGTDEEGNPINLDHFVKYNFAKQHPQVAKSKDEMMSKTNFKYYLLDPKKEVKAKNNLVQIAKKASLEFLKSTEDENRMRNLLRILNTKVNVDGLEKDDVENLLYDLQNKNPKRFLSVAGDATLDLRAEISEFVQYSVLQKIGNAVINLDETLGENMDEAVIYLKNPKRSTMLTQLRIRLKEAKS